LRRDLGVVILTVSYRIAQGLMTRLQSVQNADARLVSGARRYANITPVLHEVYALSSGFMSGGFQHGTARHGRRQLVSDDGRRHAAAFCHIKDVCCTTTL